MIKADKDIIIEKEETGGNKMKYNKNYSELIMINMADIISEFINGRIL